MGFDFSETMYWLIEIFFHPVVFGCFGASLSCSIAHMIKSVFLLSLAFCSPRSLTRGRKGVQRISTLLATFITSSNSWRWTRSGHLQLVLLHRCLGPNLVISILCHLQNCKETMQAKCWTLCRKRVRDSLSSSLILWKTKGLKLTTLLTCRGSSHRSCFSKLCPLGHQAICWYFSSFTSEIRWFVYCFKSFFPGTFQETILKRKKLAKMFYIFLNGYCKNEYLFGVYFRNGGFVKISSIPI